VSECLSEEQEMKRRIRDIPNTQYPSSQLLPLRG
jgi:hypothetical protein